MDYSKSDQSQQISRLSFKTINSKLFLICLLIIIITCLFFIRNMAVISSINIFQIQQKLNRIKPIAFIITGDCQSLRYNTAKENIERVFPHYFQIICFRSTPLNDSRIHSGTDIAARKYSSLLLAYIDIWTYEIPKRLPNNELGWSFIFEDDVNFIDPGKFSLPNYIEPLEKLQHNSEAQLRDGFFYLGICSPTYDKDTQLIVSKNMNKSLICQKGYGYCSHGTGITVKRARLFWSEIASYQPSPTSTAVDQHICSYSSRSQNHYYTLGSNSEFPPNTGHYGIAYQDRARFRSTIS